MKKISLFLLLVIVLLVSCTYDPYGDNQGIAPTPDMPQIGECLDYTSIWCQPPPGVPILPTATLYNPLPPNYP